MIPLRHPNDANGARPEHGALARREYGLLASEEPVGDPDTTEPHVSGNNPENTADTGCGYGMGAGT